MPSATSFASDLRVRRENSDLPYRASRECTRDLVLLGLHEVENKEAGCAWPAVPEALEYSRASQRKL